MNILPPGGVIIMSPDGTDAKIIIPYAEGANWFPGGEPLVQANWDITKQTRFMITKRKLL
ncbi:MAG: hypothetical protein WD267_12030 [Balneolales bacterium]